MANLFELFPQFADFVHVWGLSVAYFFTNLGIDFPPADWNVLS